MNLTIAQATATRSVFVMFAKRDLGLTHAQAHEEFDRLMATSTRPSLREYYVKTARIGASFALTRRQRMSVYDSFANAVNHATFEV